jgi:hypothetical protein
LVHQFSFLPSGLGGSTSPQGLTVGFDILVALHYMSTVKRDPIGRNHSGSTRKNSKQTRKLDQRQK